MDIERGGLWAESQIVDSEGVGIDSRVVEDLRRLSGWNEGCGVSDRL